MKINTINYCASSIFGSICRVLQTAVLLIILMTLPGCSNYYQIHAVKEKSLIDTIAALQKSGKQFIIHSKDTSFRLLNPSISDDTLKGNLFPLTEIQLKYLRPTSRTKNNYLEEHASEVLNQVHLYTTDSIINSNSKTGLQDSLKYSFPFSSFPRVDINEKNTKATKKSKTIGSLIAASVLVTASIVAVSAINFFPNGINIF